MYDVTISATEGGTVSPQSGSFEEGSSVTLTATPNAEYEFTKWSNGSTQNPLVLTVTSDLTIQATFTKKQYELTISKEGEGTVNEKVVNSGKGYDSGTKIELTAVPAGEWVFAGWSGDVNSTDNPLQVTISSPKNIKAKFVKRKYPLTINIEGQGTVTEEIVNTGRTTDYDSGTTVRLTAIPSDGWVFVGWKNYVISKDYNIDVYVNKEISINATFEKAIFQDINNESDYLFIGDYKSTKIYLSKDRLNWSDAHHKSLSDNLKLIELESTTKTSIISMLVEEKISSVNDYTGEKVVIVGFKKNKVNNKNEWISGNELSNNISSATNWEGIEYENEIGGFWWFNSQNFGLLSSVQGWWYVTEQYPVNYNHPETTSKKPIAYFQFDNIPDCNLSKIDLINKSLWGNQNQWFVNDQFYSDELNISLPLEPQNNYKITLKTTNSNGYDIFQNYISTNCRLPYTTFFGDVLELYEWKSTKLKFHTQKQYDPNIINDILINYEKAIEFYNNATQETNILNKTYEIYTVNRTCGAGCGQLGGNKIEILNIFFDRVYNSYSIGGVLDHIIVYELGRNFWTYGNKFVNIEIATPFAIYMRTKFFVSNNIKTTHMNGVDYYVFEDNLRNIIMEYYESENYNFEKNILSGQTITKNNITFSSSDILASFLLMIDSKYDIDLHNKIWKLTDNLTNSNNLQDSIDNLYILLSLATQENLIEDFALLKTNVSNEAITYVINKIN
jgi:hypothetical protein